MPLETATTINQLVTSNPADTDSEGQGGAHLRLIKSTLQATFPNVTGAVTPTHTALNLLTLSNGALRFNGAVPVGSMHAFPADPGSSLVARGGTAAGTEQYIECDGSTYLVSKFPDLAASGLVTVVSSNFTVPLLTDTGRFLRSRIPGTTAAGVSQANQNAAHTHTVSSSGTTSTESANHSHTFSGTTGTENAAHTHPIAVHQRRFILPACFWRRRHSPQLRQQQATTGTENQNHGHDYGGTTTGISASHTHTVTVTGTTASNGGAEARPESFSVMWTLKT